MKWEDGLRRFCAANGLKPWEEGYVESPQQQHLQQQQKNVAHGHLCTFHLRNAQHGPRESKVLLHLKYFAAAFQAEQISEVCNASTHSRM